VHLVAMRTQAEAPKNAARVRAFLEAVAGLVLFAVTLGGEGLGAASARWVVVYLGAATVGDFVSLGPSAEALAWALALAPLGFSVAGLFLPGTGRFWRRRQGARHASAEEAIAVEEALDLLSAADSKLKRPGAYYVIDEPLPSASVRGSAVLISSGLIEAEAVAAVLGHESEHLNSLDGRLTVALSRLVLWDDPFCGGAGSELDSNWLAGLLFGSVRWLVRLAGGGCALWLLGPIWAAYWRMREYAADARAARLGQGEDLAQHLADCAQPFESPREGFVDRLEHPPVAYRLERLRRLSEESGPE
jgi:Zn-dependent protease with chaperone function